MFSELFFGSKQLTLCVLVVIEFSKEGKEVKRGGGRLGEVILFKMYVG